MKLEKGMRVKLKTKEELLESGFREEVILDDKVLTNDSTMVVLNMFDILGTEQIVEVVDEEEDSFYIVGSSIAIFGTFMPFTWESCMISEIL